MKYTPYRVIAELIKELGLGSNPQDGAPWSVFAQQIPNDPDQAISVFTNGMPTQGRIQRTGETVAHEGFQVRIRDVDQNSAGEKAQEIYKSFETVIRKRITVEEEVYEVPAIHNTMTVAFIGLDENNRPNFVLNCKAVVRQITEDEA